MTTTLQLGYRTLALEYVQTREQWLERAAALMRERLIPQLQRHRCRVSCGWPHKAAVARTARRVGECWFPQHSTDHTSHNLFISPALQDPVEVLQTLAHELVHVAAGPNTGHKGAFVKIAKAIGFKAPWTSTPATLDLIGRLNGLVVNLGPYPHAAIDKSGRKKQGTRMLKAICPNPDCEILEKLGKPVIGRFSQEMADAGLPYCAGCGTQLELAS
jgi:uncharacterized damage-inducible protein DinB